jgi:hypothetical protein
MYRINFSGQKRDRTLGFSLLISLELDALKLEKNAEKVVPVFLAADI